ncbi:MAG: hypothetical protein Q9220_002216 [cf. Caloplaca sp. 1 TL-2023]
MATPKHGVDDLDDLVYISDNESTTISTPTSTLTSIEPGMIAEVKNLYPGERDELGRVLPTDQIPELPEPEETEETARYALFIRHRKCFGSQKGLAISSVVVQSPLLKKVLCWVLKDYPCMAPELDRLEVVAPFRPFIHRWQRLTDALNNEKDPETKSHIQLFYDALKSELDLTLETRDDFAAHKTITFNSLWMIFEPGDVIIATLNKRQVAARLKNSLIHVGKHEDVYRLECEVIVANAGKWGWTNQWFDIPEYGGMQKIEELSAYPLKFHPKVERITKSLIQNGKRFEQLVDSRIMVDADAYICYHPDHDCILKPVKEESTVEDSDSSDDDIEEKRSTMPPLTDEQRMLCSSMVRGYSLRNKRWLHFFIDSIKDIEWNARAWDDVALDHEDKDLLFEITDGHHWNHKGLSTKGLNILLSGPTGVGKTFIVKSLAETLHAPLFQVTKADVDLDLKNPDLESPFTDVLEMCGRWNAILLFDEAQSSIDNMPPDDMLENQYSAFAREKVWQTCLRSLKDVSFFGDTKYLSRWRLNGREIANAVTTARTLAGDRVLEMRHLERVVPIAKRGCLSPDYSTDSDMNSPKTKAKKGKEATAKKDVDWDDWDSFKPAKDKKKSKKVDESTDHWDEWGMKKEKTKPKKEKLPELSSPPPPPPPPPPMDDWKNEDIAWGGFGMKKEKKSKKVAVKETEQTLPAETSTVMPPPPPPPPVDDLKWGFGTSTKDEDDVWGFGTKKIKKVEKAAVQEVQEIAPPEVKETPPAEVEDWGFWTSSKKSKKKGKKGIVEPAVEIAEPVLEIVEPPPAPVVVNLPVPVAANACRVCSRDESVLPGQYCTRCGTFEGESKQVCESCALAKGFNATVTGTECCEVC